MIRANDEQELRQQMEWVRQSLADDRAGIQEAKSNLLNPKKVAARHPLIAIGLAVAAGFVLAPRLGKKSESDLPALNVENGFQSVPKNSGAAGKSLLGGLASLALGTAGRFVIGMASRKLGDVLASHAGTATDQKQGEDGRSLPAIFDDEVSKL